MDPEAKPNQPVETKAEAALELLRSLARAGEDPDKFAQACLDWSRLSEDASSIPEFQSVLALLSPKDGTGSVYQGETISDPNLFKGAKAHPSDVFELTPNGTVSRIDKELSEVLALRVGDSVDPSLFQHLSDGDASQQKGDFLIEIHDRFRIGRQVQIHPQTEQGEITGFRAHVFRARLHMPLREHLQGKFGLTASEVEILELVLQRHTLEQIADIRGIKLNTVRTHIARLIGKLNCHSLVEAVATTLELSSVLGQKLQPLSFDPEPDEVASRRIRLKRQDKEVEYRRYGASAGAPIVVLHSLEYGYMPSQAMIDVARTRGLNLIFPLRPGFGETTPDASFQDAVQSLRAFLKALDLKDATLVGLSTAAPLALAVQENNRRVRHTALVNYGLNVTDKLTAIQPAWIRGMLRMAMNSPSSFGFGLRTLTAMIRTFGGLRFYRKLYGTQSTDLEFLEANPDLFQSMANYLVKADKSSIRLDILSAFMPNREVETLLSKRPSISVLNSVNQHGVGLEESQAEAQRLGVQFKPVEFAGRNWMFQHPEAFFDFLAPETVH